MPCTTVRGMCTPRILAHRGNTDGPSTVEENRLPAIRRALASGWGLEIDIRRAGDGRFYISHDPQPSANALSAEDFCNEVRRFPDATVALNVKECGDEADLIAFLASENLLRQTFLFDMELIEPAPGGMARLFRALHPTVSLAARISDRGESIQRALTIDVASVVWLDEFDTAWATKADVRRLQAAGRAVFAVSPDLHQFPIGQSRARWLDFYAWGVDGICTDYPADLARVLDRASQGVAV